MLLSWALFLLAYLIGGWVVLIFVIVTLLLDSVTKVFKWSLALALLLAVLEPSVLRNLSFPEQRWMADMFIRLSLVLLVAIVFSRKGNVLPND
jgi:hypothetical protein